MYLTDEEIVAKIEKHMHGMGYTKCALSLDIDMCRTTISQIMKSRSTLSPTTRRRLLKYIAAKIDKTPIL